MTGEPAPTGHADAGTLVEEGGPSALPPAVPVVVASSRGSSIRSATHADVAGRPDIETLQSTPNRTSPTPEKDEDAKSRAEGEVELSGFHANGLADQTSYMCAHPRRQSFDRNLTDVMNLCFDQAGETDPGRVHVASARR